MTSKAIATLWLSVLLCGCAGEDAGGTADRPGAGGKQDDADDATGGGDPCDEYEDTDRHEECVDFHSLADLDIEARRELVADPDLLPGDVDDQGIKDFDFCTNTGPGLKLENAAWLAFVSANEYSHLKNFAPVLTQLGFGRPGDDLTALCYADLVTLREQELQWQEDPSSKPTVYDGGTEYGLARELTICARGWYEQEFGRDDDEFPTQGLASMFEAFLVDFADPASGLQFFSGGEFEIDDSIFYQGSTQAVWMEHSAKPVAIVGFRGTEPNQLQDVLVDLTFFKDALVDFPHWHHKKWGKVHRGFNRAVLATVGTRLLEKVDSLEPRDEDPIEVWVTGHSLGASLATLFTSALLEKIERGENLDGYGMPRWVVGGQYTFGSPRTGNDDFKEQLETMAVKHDIPVIRFRNHDDLVTRVPPFGYEHTGVLSYFDAQGQLEFDPSDIDEPFFGSVEDHGMEYYYGNIISALAQPEHAAFTGCD